MRYLLLLVALSLAAPAQAHDLWFDPLPDGAVLHYGHQHSGHEGVALLDAQMAPPQTATCLPNPGAPDHPAPPTALPFRFTHNCAAWAVNLTPTFWSKTVYGTKPQPKNEVPGAIRAWQSREALTWIASWRPELTQPLAGKGLELSPLENPLALGVDDKLHLLATFDGQPVAGVTVAYRGDPRGVSDDAGHINIRLKEGGVQLIEASLERPFPGPEADQTIWTATLQFEIAP